MSSIVSPFPMRPMMSLELDVPENRALRKWAGVGDFPTPSALVEDFAEEFSKYAVEVLSKSKTKKQCIRIADFFSGDGRLGIAIGKRLEKALSIDVALCFLEANPLRAKAIVLPSKKSEIVVADGFKTTIESQFDLVVSNPPYLSLDRARSKKLLLDWELVKSGGGNLYGLAMLKCIAACKAGGLVGVIAPFGWTRGVLSSQLRTELTSSTEKIVVHALPDRSLFPNVHQDIAFQFFVKRNENAIASGEALFGINGHPFSPLDLNTSKSVGKKEGIRVRVGPLVWNRTTLKLKSTDKNAVLIVNGGNIDAGKLETSLKKYEKRQYVSRKGLNMSDVSRAPLLLLRRTLRGRPGEWKVDSYLRTSDFRCVAENHVIAIELPKDIKRAQAEKLQRAICTKILDIHSVSGTPNLSVLTVRNAVSACY